MSEWDNLWKSMPLPVTDQWGRTDNGPLMVFVMKVKAEGDKLNEKAEELDFIKTEYGNASPESLTRDALKLKISVLERKLKAVKQVVDEWGRQRDDPYGLEYDWYYKDKYYALEKALGEEA